jgi:hypothetical protein
VEQLDRLAGGGACPLDHRNAFQADHLRHWVPSPAHRETAAGASIDAPVQRANLAASTEFYSATVKRKGRM